MVSDGAKALVKLAISGLGCPSVPDVFHLLYGLSKSMGTAIARQRKQLQKQQNALQERMAAIPAQSHPALTAQSNDLHSQQQTLERDHRLKRPVNPNSSRATNMLLSKLTSAS